MARSGTRLSLTGARLGAWYRARAGRPRVRQLLRAADHGQAPGGRDCGRIQLTRPRRAGGSRCSPSRATAGGSFGSRPRHGYARQSTPDFRIGPFASARAQEPTRPSVGRQGDAPGGRPRPRHAWANASFCTPESKPCNRRLARIRGREGRAWRDRVCPRLSALPVSSGRVKKMPGWVRPSSRATAASRFCCRRR
jgi:hypothetical protein